MIEEPARRGPRPKLGKTKHLNFQIPVTMKARLQEVAEELGEDVSVMLRRWIAEGIERETGR